MEELHVRWNMENEEKNPSAQVIHMRCIVKNCIRRKKVSEISRGKQDVKNDEMVFLLHRWGLDYGCYDYFLAFFFFF